MKNYLLSAALLMACAGAHAFEFKAIGPAPVVMYDAPSAKGKKVYVAPPSMPVEVVLTYGAWAKVRDYTGDLAWVELKALTGKRHVVVRATHGRVRQAADDGAPVLFAAEKGVILEFVEAGPAGWVKVRHRDGQGGFVRGSEVWGD
jgi:SH3-like domain-containing protein